MVDLTKEEDEESQYGTKTFTNSLSSPPPQHSTTSKENTKTPFPVTTSGKINPMETS